MNLKRHWTNASVQHHQRLRRLYAQFMQAGDVVFDAGANLGSRTRVFAELGATVIAIEPQKECVRSLYVEFHQEPRVIIVPKAVGAESGYLDMQLGNISERSSFNLELIRAKQADPRWGSATWDHTRRVPVTTLDVLIAKYGVPAFIKMDIEGFEPEALKGLSQPPAALSFEFLPIHLKPARECMAWLECFGTMRYNYAIMEEMKLLLADWVSADEMLRILAAHERTSDFRYGDVYARFKKR